MNQHISSLKLHRMRYGELSSEEVGAVRSHVDGCEQCTTRLQNQEHHRAAFEVEPVPETPTPEPEVVEAPPPMASNKILVWVILVAAIAIAATAVIILVLRST